ncbi:hypothetical protein SAMN03159341_105337 [Paenibacillus sp. 1_12]|uniref:hypothetical protein n=1 Tax=Paenibacillus sp. 1_12 TaxID=1566278 RepID=UPI0008E32469|nr:hypothetical protein [Paenibacillus sp. 1_12]SFL37498.1 hypothetical protein SAMN03159341_105337 [Paenibacillus sp. 1_12]
MSNHRTAYRSASYYFRLSSKESGMRSSFQPAVRWMGFVLVLLLLLLELNACSLLPNPRSTDSTDLLAALTFSSTNMMIDNGNDFVWKGVTLRLNNDYLLTIDLMPRGITSVSLAEFQDVQGQPFNPHSMTPHQLNIQAQAGFESKPGSFNW